MNRDILSKIEQEQMISREELEELLTTTDQELIEELYRRARATAGKYYGKEIYLRGLIEFTNYCKITVITVGSAVAMKKRRDIG